MTGRASGGRRSLSGVLYDIAHVLESVGVSADRLRRVLVLLRCAVPYDECALLEAQPAQPTRIIVEPDVQADARGELVAMLDGLLLNLVAERSSEPAVPPGAHPRAAGGRLVVPLVGNGEVIGLLFVRRAAGGYAERHLRALSIVGGQLAAYLSMVRAHEQMRVRAHELDAARRAALAVGRAKDEFLAALSHELRDPVASTLAWTHLLGAAIADPDWPARAVAAIERNARSLAKLIDGIQGLARVASPEIPVDLRTVEPARLLRAAIEGLRPGPGGKGEPAPALSRDPAPRTLDGIRVLLVDDDPDILEAFQWVLEHYGAVVTVANSAVAALSAFERARPDVFLCDLGMPGENGYDLMRKVAARDADLPAAAITAFGDIASPERARAAGFRMQLGKPIDAAVLVAMVADLAGRTGMGTRPARP